MASDPSRSTKLTEVSFAVPENEKEQFEAAALELSEPGDRLNPSDLYRDALRLWMEQHQDDGEACAPRSRGQPRPDDSEGGN